MPRALTEGATAVLVGVRLSERDAERLRKMAEADDRPVSAMARKLLGEQLRRAESAEGVANVH